MTPYQQKNYDAVRANQLLSLERGVAPTAYDLVKIAVDMANARGVEKIQAVERDPVTLEIVTAVTVEVPSYSISR